MIPKQIFFLWFGNKKPNYVDFAVNSFKRINSDFKVDLINYTTEQLENWENCNDEILKNTIKELKSRKWHNKFMPFNNKFIVVHISDTYRRKLLNKYGGIYLDCDTFPVRPFDDELLKNKSFKSKYLCFKNNKHISSYIATFFCGSSKCHFTEHDEKRMKRIIYLFRKEQLKRFLSCRNLFLECQLKESFNKYPLYIDHYEDHSWVRNKKQQILDVANIL